MALAFIGEAVASTIIGKLVETACTAVEENLFPDGDMEAVLERLQFALPQIKAVLCAVESDEIKNQNKALTAWMWQFRDAVEYAEDVLDEMEYYELEDKIKSPNEKADPSASASTSSSKRKFLEFIGHKFKADNHGILRKLEKSVKGLDKVASSVHTFLDLQRGLSGFHGKNYEDKNVQNDRETGSMITESVVFGRVTERDSIVEWLTGDPSSDDVTLSGFTIYGIGGLGKTTLAQLIYNDGRAKQFFDPIIWVCVSDQFDAVTIITKILEVMSNESPKVRSLSCLQDSLKERLRSKRFLLVLDDVWNDENRSQWEKLVAPLKFGQGKILVTTRMESVADMVAKVVEGKNDRLKLNGLDENEFLKLLNKHAFNGADPNEYINLHPIGKQIAMKLGGCPLAAKIMGGVLNYDIEFGHWNKTLKEDVPNFQTGKDSIMAVLRLSYCHLPTYLQLCFRYCSIFPKDYEFRKNELIKMWMGSGLIEPLGKRQMPEDVGMDYFNLLVRKSFFDLKCGESFFDLKYDDKYVMHDLLHDLAQSVSEGECLGIEGSSSQIPKTIRHLGVNTESIVDITEISELKSLRTLFVCFRGNYPDLDEIHKHSEVLKRLKSLRLLRVHLLSRDTFKVLDAIGELIHLRYLSLELDSLYESSYFPMAMYKLYHLEFIVVNYSCLKSIKISGINEIVNLTKLRYIYLDSDIVSQISSVGKLTFLQGLDSFHIRPEIGHMISELRDLLSLRKLAITNLDKVNNPIEAKEAKLNEKENLNKLSLSWSKNNNMTLAVHEQLLNNLQPHQHLNELSINGYGGMRFPIWINDLSNLKRLELSQCFLLAGLPALGNLTLLKSLYLCSLPQVKKIDQTFYGKDTECVFPVLKVLTLSKMEELEGWDEVQGITLFPRLESLKVIACIKLRKLPTLPPSLEMVHIENVGLEILPRIYPIYNNGIIIPSHLSYLRVRECPNLTSLDGCLLQQKDVRQALSRLFIENCERLMSPPSRGFIDFTSVKKISIDKCPILTGAPDAQQNLLPSSLQSLTIGWSGLDEQLLGSVRNCTALTALNLYGCRIISSLPPFEVLTKLIALNHLKISHCPEFSSLGGLEALTSLRYLHINDCGKLTTISMSQPPVSANANDSNPLRLDKLLVDRASLLLLEPLRSLRLTKALVIADDSDLTCMPEEWLLQNHSTLRGIIVGRATSLELLPSCMDKLKLLENLYINGAPLIQSLPDLPPSLNNLLITGCHPVLKERYKKDSGPEWHKIAFISRVYIN